MQPVGASGAAAHGWLVGDIDAHATISDGRMWGRPFASLVKYRNTPARRPISIASGGDAAVMACADGVVRVWDTARGRLRAELPPAPQAAGQGRVAFHAAAFVPADGLDELWAATPTHTFVLGVGRHVQRPTESHLGHW